MNSKNKLNVFKRSYLPLTYWKNWFRNIKQFFISFKYAWQRATKGYCDADVWNLDIFYTNLISASLKQLAETSHSFPHSFNNFEAWAEWLKDTASLIDTSADDSYLLDEFDEVEYKKKIEARTKAKDEALDRLKKYWFDLWD